MSCRILSDRVARIVRWLSKSNVETYEDVKTYFSRVGRRNSANISFSRGHLNGYRGEETRGRLAKCRRDLTCRAVTVFPRAKYSQRPSSLCDG